MSASKSIREKWNAEHYTQINISVDKGLAVGFKSACAERGISIAGAVKSFMAAYSCSEERLPGSRTEAKKPSRGARRKEVSDIITALTTILAEEEIYLENMPENLTHSIRAEAASDSISSLAEAIEMLADAY